MALGIQIHILIHPFPQKRSWVFDYISWLPVHPFAQKWSWVSDAISWSIFFLVSHFHKNGLGYSALLSQSKTWNWSISCRKMLFDQSFQKHLFIQMAYFLLYLRLSISSNYNLDIPLEHVKKNGKIFVHFFQKYVFDNSDPSPSSKRVLRVPIINFFHFL